MLTVPESRLSVPDCSGLSTNVPFPGSFIEITTRCFAASGPAAATDVSVTAAASATSMACRAFIASLPCSGSTVEWDDRPGAFQVRFRPATAGVAAARFPLDLAPAGNSPVGLDPAGLGSLDERCEATSLDLISFESGRVDLTLEREVLLMKRDFLRPWLMTVVEVAHGYAKRIDSTICLTSLFSPAVA